MPKLPPPILEFGTESAADADGVFTLAIGGTAYLAIFSRMVHVNFQKIAHALWWDDGKSGEEFSEALQRPSQL